MSESPAGNQQAGPSVASSPPCLLEDFSLPRLAYPFFPKEAAAPHNLDPNRRLKWMRYRPWIRFPTIPTQIVLLSPFSPCLYGASRARPMATLSGGGRQLLLRRVHVVRNNHDMDMSLCYEGVLVEHECVCELRRVCVRHVGAYHTIVESGCEREFVPPQPLVVWG
jgi:hypothetical protein